MDKKEFLTHNDIFIELSRYEGFYRYEKETQNKLCFQGLLSFITESYKGGIDNLNGYDKSYYTKFKKSQIVKNLQTFTRF